MAISGKWRHLAAYISLFLLAIVSKVYHLHRRTLNTCLFRAGVCMQKCVNFHVCFGGEIGGIISFLSFQDLVVNQKVRPLIKDSWRGHPGLSALCDTIEECWDQARWLTFESCAFFLIVIVVALNG